jgi:predicted proteasome-type protease
MAEPHGSETYRQATAEGLLLDWFAFLRQRWSESLREAYQALPRPDWLG